MKRTISCVATGCWNAAAVTIGGVSLCAAHLERVKGELTVPAPPPVPSAVVYFMSFDQGKTVKIGTSTSPTKRLKALETRHGAGEMLAAQAGHYTLERALHWEFQDLLVRGSRRMGREFFRNEGKLTSHMNEIHATRPDWREMVLAVDMANTK